MSQWFLAIDGAQQGPYAASQVQQMVHSGQVAGSVLAWRDGMANWIAIEKVAELTAKPGTASAAPSIPTPGVPAMADEIDYTIHGSECQFIEIELDPQESAVAEAGAMMYMSDGINMNTVFGDGSPQEATKGFLDHMLGAGKRLLTGESLFMTLFTHTGSGKAHVAFAAPYPGRIIPMDLASLGGKVLCQKKAFLCAARGVEVGIAFQKKIGVGLFGGEGFILQKLEGNGLAFVHAGGSIIEKTLEAGQSLRVDTGCIVAMMPSVDFNIEMVGGVKSALFGGEGFFYARLQGPGKVWLQSLPFSRLAGTIHKAAPQNGGSTGQGSALDGILGQGLGNIISGG